MHEKFKKRRKKINRIRSIKDWLFLISTAVLIFWILSTVTKCHGENIEEGYESLGGE